MSTKGLKIISQRKNREPKDSKDGQKAVLVLPPPPPPPPAPPEHPQIIDILTNYNYPVLKSVLKHLHQCDVAALRKSCRSLRQSLSPTYPNLVLSCQAKYPFQSHTVEKEEGGLRQATYWRLNIKHHRETCNSGPLWEGEVRECKTSMHIQRPTNPYGKEPNPGTFPHEDRGLWICRPCSEIGLKIMKRNEIWAKFFGRLNGSLLPICRSCFTLRQASRAKARAQDATKARARDAAKAKAREAVGRATCSCLQNFYDLIEEGWYCLECTAQVMERLFKGPIGSRSISWEENSASNSGKLCALCYEAYASKDGAGELDLYACMECEDLFTVKNADAEEDSALEDKSENWQESDIEEGLDNEESATEEADAEGPDADDF